jgi:hypothetical protein
VSAKQKLSPPLSLGSIVSCLALGLALLFLAISARADSLEDAARVLARKVASTLHGMSVTYEVRNLSSLRGKEFSNLSAAFQEELQQHGAKVLPADAAASVVLTVTENTSSYLGIVQIRRKENSDTIMEPLGPMEGAPVAELMYKLVLHKEFLFSRDAPMVDVLLAGDDRHAYALGLQEISSYELQGDSWVLTGTVRLSAHPTLAREIRGFLYFEIDTEAAYLSGELCRISPMAGKVGKCEKYQETMPVRSVSTSVVAGKKMGSWFSAAQLGPEEATRIVVTGRDGLARLYEEGPDPISVFPGWGSEVASIHSGCGHGWQLLVTGTGDWTHADTIQAMEIRERQAQAVSSPIELPGAVIALHYSAARNVDEASASSSAVAIIRNLQTGRYEAYRLSITCPK